MDRTLPGVPRDRWVDVEGMRIRCPGLGCLPAPAARPGSRVLLMVHGWSGSAERFSAALPTPPARRARCRRRPAGQRPLRQADASYDLEFFLAFLRSLSQALGWTGSCSLATPWAAVCRAFCLPVAGPRGPAHPHCPVRPGGPGGSLAHPREVGRIPGLCLPSQFAVSSSGGCSA